MKRLLAFLSVLALVLSAGIGLSACSGSGADDYAARVNGNDIPTKTVLDELHVITSNPKYVSALNTQLGSSGNGTSLQPSGPNTVNAQYTAQLLWNRVIVEIIDENFYGQHLSTTPEDVSAAEKTVRQDVSDDVFNSMPTSYRDYLVQRLAKLSAVMTARDNAQAEQSYYDSHKADLTQYCVRHILVTSQTQAAQLRKQIVDDGSDFAAIARQSSLDNQGTGSSASQGGALGCFSRTDLDQFIPEFRDAVLKLQPNEVSQPVHTQFGYHLIQITSQTTPSFTDAKSSISKKLSDVDSFINDELSKATIKVNPRFGKYSPASATTGAAAGITPPAINAVTPKSTTTTMNPNALGGGTGVPGDAGTGGTDSVPVQ